MSKIRLSFLLAVLLFVTGVRMQCTVYCQKCNIGVCQQCKEPYNLNDKGLCKIYKFIQGCLVYSSEADVDRCVTCSKDRQLINGKCNKISKNCQTIDETSECKKCIDGFELVGRKCLSKNVKNCPVGHFAYQNYCRPYQISNCLSINQGICQICSLNSILINGVCLPKSCSITPVKNTPCVGTIFQKMCYNCIPNNCILSQNGIHCDLCMPSFILIGGMCYKPVKYDDINCNLVDTRTQICTGCNTEYKLDRNAFCVRDFNVGIKDCIVSPLFDAFQDGCFYRDRNCQKINPLNFQCMYCVEGFTLRAGKCEKTEKCITKMISGDCIDCLSQFYLHPTKRTCQEKPRNCINFSLQQNKCNLCKGPTALTNLTKDNRTVCAYIQSKCAQYNNQGTCLSCIEGFVIKNRICTMKAEFCQSYNPVDQTLCSSCMLGYKMQDLKCYQNIYGCIRYNATNTKCVRCSRNLVLYQGRCIFIDKYCSQYSQQGNCMRCSQGLVPYGNKCVYYQPFCTSYGLDRICNKASYGFTIKSGISSDIKQEYRIFILSASKIKTTLNIRTEKKLRSMSDQKGSYLQNGVIQYYPLVSLESKSIKQIRSLYQVISCQDSFIFYQGICIKKQAFDSNCKQYNTITLQCVLCLQGHDMGPSTRCQKRSNKSCTEFDKGTQNCAKCNQKQGFFNVGGWCVSKLINISRDEYHFEVLQGRFMWPLSPFCIQQRQIGKCLTCQQGYAILQGKCVIFQKFCVSYHQLGFCLRCQPQYSLQGANCVPINCQKSNSLTCANCIKGYQYQSGKCYPPKLSNCIIYSPNECRLCQPQFYLTQSKRCQKSLQNCIVMNITSLQCIQCEQMYTLSRQKCILSIQNCLDYNLEGKCRKCVESSTAKYQLIDGRCRRIPNRCVKLDKDQGCEECQQGYTLNKKQCVVYRENCQNYDRTGRCFKCAQSYVLRNGVCFATISFCKQINQAQNKCIRCFDGYQLTKESTCAVSDSKCKQFKNGFCTQCEPGFYIGTVGSGFCQKNPQNCQRYNVQDKKCIGCLNNYMLVNNLCVFRSIVLNGCINQRLQQPNCLVCQSGFTVKNGLCYSSNCLTYTPERNCLDCPRYYRQSKRDTRLCQPHFCRIYSKGATCDFYQPNYMGGFLIHASGRISIQYCKEYDSINNNCIQCQSYRFPQFSYQYSPCFPYNCLNSSEIKCTKCKPGFGLSKINQGTCLASFCLQPQNNGTCKTCSKPYIRNQQGICVTNSVCLQYQSSSPRCKKCQNLYNLNEAGQCLAQNCDEQKIDPSEGCAKCRLGFERVQNGGCKLKFCQVELLDSFCKNCSPNYRKNNINGICQPKNCINYQRQSYKCTRCQTGFRLQNGLCRPSNCLQQKNLQCSRCQSGYMPSSTGKCQTQYCKKFNNVRECIQCQSGYLFNPQTGLCQTQNSFCIENDVNNACKRCSIGYVLNNRRNCVAEVKGCKVYGALQCQSCSKGLQYRQKECRVMNCLNQQSSIACNKCKTGYQLTSQRLCKVKNCEMFSEEGWTCNNCFGRFSLFKGICQARDCSMYSVLDQITCLLCNQDYELVDGGCLHKNCQNPKDNKCRSCIEGWVPDFKGVCSSRSCLTSDFKTGICKTCDPGKRLSKDVCISDRCLARLQTSQCNLCDRSFYLTNNRQFCVAYFCQNWDSSNGQCLKCADNFTLEKSICINKLCRKFNNTNSMIMPFCQECSPGYYPYNQYCVPIRCMNHGYDPLTGECSECVFSFQPVNGVCQLQNCMKFLQNVTDFSQCQICKLGFERSSGICLAANCSQFQPSTSKCIGCNYGFYLISDICLAYNCLTYQPDGRCRICQPSYNLQANYSCTRKNCLQDSIEQCLICQDGYQIVDKYCHNVNCKTEQQNVCIQCQNGLFKDNGICKDLNCDTFSPTYKCQKCRKGFKLSKAGRCQLQYTTFCPIGQYYSQLKLMCQKIMIQNCKYAQYNQPNYCIECMSGYFLFNGICQSLRGCRKFSYFGGCTECQIGLKLINNICLNPDGFCLSRIQGRCSSCKQGYYLSKINECTQKPVNCKQLSRDFQCLKCQNNYELVSQARGCKASNCTSYDPDSLKCKQCSAFYELSKQGSCLSNSKKIQNCREYNTNNSCSRCQDGFSLGVNATTCVKINQGCELFGVNGVCLICKANYIRLQGRCVLNNKKQPEDVKKNTSQTKQLSLSVPASIPEVKKDTQVSYIENCLIQDDFKQICMICNIDFYKTSSGKCLPVPQYCKFVDTSGLCYMCNDGYNLKNNRCIKDAKSKTSPVVQPISFFQVQKSTQNLRRSIQL